MSDWQLLSAYNQGDEGAFASLVKKYLPMVYSAAVRQVGDPHLAEEIAQSVFILLSRKAKSLSASVSLCGWLLRATRFIAKDALKMLHRRRQKEQELSVNLKIDQNLQPAWTSIAPLLDEALLALSASEQESVLARFFEGRNFKEIGERQAISENAAQKRLSRSVEKMKHFFERRGVRAAGAIIPAMLAANFAQSAEVRMVEAAIQAAHAAAQGKVIGGNSLLLADRVARLLAWRHVAGVGFQFVLPVLLVLGGGLAVWSEMRLAPPAGAAFQVSDARIETLGRAWSQVVLRVASLFQKFPQPPVPTDPRHASYLADYNFVIAETVRISTKLDALLQPADERIVLAQFLTVELGETLDLSARQKAAVFALLKDGLARGATILEGMKAVAQAKRDFSIAIKAQLSRRQQTRFDRTYGKDARGLFAFLSAATMGK